MRNCSTSALFRGLCLTICLAFFSFAAFAQNGTHQVKGLVVDKNGEPLPGVAVLVEGTTVATLTDDEGKYTVQADNSQTIIFNMLGMLDVRETVGQRAVIDVTMQDDNMLLDEAVAIGYSTIKKRDLTGSVASVGSDAIMKSIPTSADQVLQGRAAGVQLTQNSGLPGGGSSIRIRGVNSLNSSNEPIIVIDGVIIDGSTGNQTDNALSSINPSDIETMDILKDASATAIYGAQGANGVILITTKRGHAGRTNVSLDIQAGFQQLPKYLSVMDFPQYATMYNEYANMRGATQRDEYADPSILPVGTDWQRELFKTAPMQQYNLSVNGGNEKVTYAISGGYLNQDGIAYGSSFDRYTIRANVDVQAKSWLKVGASTSMSHSNQNFNSLAGNDEGLIKVALRQTPGVAAHSIDGGYDAPDDQWLESNPLGLANLLENKNNKSGIRSNAYVDITFYKGLSFKTEFSNDINFTNTYNFTPTYKFGQYFYNSENSRSEQKNYSIYWAWRNILTYNNTFGKHSINAMLGHEMTSSHWEYLQGKRLYGPDNLHDMSAGDATSATNNGGSGNTRFMSFFARAFYSYDDRYLITATLRADGSSNFAKGHRWGYFPSVAAAWRISGESFFKDNVTVMNELKLRFGYGSVGNSNVPANAWQATLNTVPTNWGNGYLTGRIPNENLTWETTKSYNVGLDMGFLKDRITLAVDAYYKVTDNLLMEAVLPAYVGTSGQGSAAAPFGNMGAILNRGVEFTLNSVNIEKRDFSWTSSLVFSLNNNKVQRLNTDTGVIDRTYQVDGKASVVTRTQVGSSIGDFYGYQVIGRVQDANDLYDKEGNLKVALPKGLAVGRDGVWVGDWLYKDVNNDGAIDENDRVNLGSPLPLFTGGFGNTFTWKNWDLNVYLTYSYGNKVMNWLRVTMDNPNSNTNKFSRAADYAHIGLIDETGSDADIYNVYVTSAHKWMPRMSPADANDNDRISSLYIEDASYIRLQNVSLAYRLPSKICDKMKIASMRFSFNIQNLYTFSKYSGYDPEVGMTMDQYSTNGQDALMNGIDTGRYPTPRIFTFGINVGF